MKAYDMSIICALKHITIARERYMMEHEEDFDLDWVMEEFNRVIDILEDLKEYQAARWEEQE